MRTPLRRYYDFSGRSGRKEFWLWILFVLLVEAALVAALGLASSAAEGRMNVLAAIPLALLILSSLAAFVPTLAVTVRRLHDQGRSGAFLLLALVPLAGSLALLVLMALEGTRGPNRYGADPRAGAAAGEAIGP